MVVIVVVGVNEGRCHEAIAVAEVFPEVVYQGVFGEGKPILPRIALHTRLEDNMASIAAAGSVPQHHGVRQSASLRARVDLVPCGWSRADACDMSRPISRRENGRAVPRMTRARSASLRRRCRRYARELRSLERAETRASEVVQSVDSGYELPYRTRVGQIASLVSLAVGLDAGMAF